jgi:AcrR family transcriptional regulator
VRRHFPTRRALLEAVSRERIAALCARAHELAAADDGRTALLDWMGEVVAYCVVARGLAAALAYDATGTDPAHGNSCSAALEEAAGPLLRRAAVDGAVADDVTVEDLITLAVGIALATEQHPEPAARAERLLGLTVAGLSPRR